jgi:hypothetical protein
VIALASDNVLMLMVDSLERLEVTCPLALAVLANCGAAVTDVLVDDEVERVTRVVMFDGDGTELAGIEEEDAEFVMLEVMAAELIDGEEEGTVLVTG